MPLAPQDTPNPPQLGYFFRKFHGSDALAGIFKARPEDEWHEDYGDVLWWTDPITEPPYVGSPLCDDWPGYHSFWTPLPCCELIQAGIDRAKPALTTGEGDTCAMS